MGPVLEGAKLWEQGEGACHQGKWGPCKQRLVQQTSINVARPSLWSLLLFVCLSCCSNKSNNKRNLQHFQVALAA